MLIFGRKSQYESIICENYKQIYRLLVYLANDSSIAEDLTQETFLRAWASLKDFKEKSSVSTWLNRIAYNAFIDSIRKQKKFENASPGPGDSNSQVIPSPLQTLLGNETSKSLYAAINKLGQEEKYMIVLHYIQGFSFSEMSGILVEPVGTVKWRTNQALQKIRGHLGNGEL